MVDQYDISSVKMITSGAAPLTKELVDAVHKRLNLKINQAYGLSETSPMTHTQVRYSSVIWSSELIRFLAMGRVV